jgi:S-adenosylmethionine:tRNA ribosyltransferase-isomerase
VVGLHLSTPDPGDPARWIVELRRDGARVRDARCRERLALAGGGRAQLVAPYLSAGRLWIAALELPAPVLEFLARHGAPIRYAHQPHDWPLADHQTIFARVPGSAEMPSAGRPFTPRVLARLGHGVGVAAVVLHTGVSSLERGERPYPERFEVPAATAARVNAAHAAGGRVVAVGTTVTRALETAAAADGTVRAAAGWTSLTITPERGVRTVDGLITGWHEPRREPPAAARGGRRAGSGRAFLCGRGGRGLPLARVRRLAPAAARARVNVNCGIERSAFEVPRAGRRALSPPQAGSRRPRGTPPRVRAPPRCRS